MAFYFLHSVTGPVYKCVRSGTQPQFFCTAQIFTFYLLNLIIIFYFLKGEKVLFLLEEEEMKQEDFLVYLTEFVVFGTISHLFSPEEQTTIINSIRTEVTQAGLSYTRDVAWNFFLRLVFQSCATHSMNIAQLYFSLRGGIQLQKCNVVCRKWWPFFLSVQ